MNSRKNVFRRLATVSALSGIGAVALAGAAAADTTVFQDAKGDMSHGADIQRVRVVNEDQVKIKVVHRDLVRSYKSGSSISVFIDTDRARKGPEFVFLGGTFEGSDYALLKADGWKRASDRQVPLRGGTYSMRVNYVEDTATIRIDRAVLQDPGAVRVEVKTGGEMVPEGDEPATTEVDWLGQPRDFAPWVKRG